MMRIKSIVLSPILILFLSLSLWPREGDAVELYEKGRFYLNRQEYYASIDLLQEALRINPSFLDAVLALADAYFRLEEYDEAYGYIERADRFGRNDLDLLNMKGRILIGKERLDEAEALFESVLEKEPNNLNAHLGLAETALLRGDKEKGIEQYRKSLILAPESRRALLSLALLYDRDRDFEKAEYYLSLALTFHARDPEVYMALAEHYLKTGDVGRAEYYALNGTRISPQAMGPYKLLGQAYMEQDKWSEAEGALIRALSADPEDSVLLYMLSHCYMNLGENDKVLRTLDKALRYDPYDEIVRLSLEQFLISNPQISSDLRDKLGQYHNRRGSDYESQFYYEKAYDEYRRSKWINPYDWESWLKLGDIFNRLGFPGKYLDTMQAIEESGYDDPVFKEKLMILEHKAPKTASSSWGIDQFDIDSLPYTLSLYPYYTVSLDHIGSESDLTDYLQFYLMRHALIEPLLGSRVRSFSQAFSDSRKRGSDFFATLNLSETDRTFLVEIKLYLTSTGALIDAFTVLRTGKGRVSEAMGQMAEVMGNAFIPRALLIDLKGNDALVGIGRFQGIEEKSKAVVLKSGEGTLLSQPPWIDYSSEDILGEIEIKALDEEVAVGTLERYSLFDLINPGDEIYFLPLGDDVAEDEVAPGEEEKRILNSDLKSQLLKLN